MEPGWQDAWTFRIVDQDTGVAVPGVPVTVLPEAGPAGGEGGYWVSDPDGLVRIPKHDRARLRLRVGLRNEEAIEFDARALGDDPIPIAAPRAGPIAPAERAAAAPPLAPPVRAAPSAGHVVRFSRVAVLPRDQDILAVSDPAPSAIRYGVLFEVDQVWQSLGARPGDVLYSVSLGPGEEVKVLVWDGRWRRKADARARSFQIVARMVAARQLAAGVDAVPLDPCVASDLEAAAADTVRLLAERTVRAGEALRHRPLGVTELNGEQPEGTSLRTLRNVRPEGVLSYHVVEPVERYQVVVRTPRVRPALLVPFRLPNLATRDVVRRFGHVLRRGLLERALAKDLEQVIGPDRPAPAAEQHIYAHIAEHLAYYSATIIAAGQPGERSSALAKLRDPTGRPLPDVIENVVVGRVGTYVAFPLRSLASAPPEWRAALADEAVRKIRAFQEITVTLPLPGVWLRSELFPAQLARDGEDVDRGEEPDARRADRRKQR